MKLNPFAKLTRAERAEQLLTEARLASLEHAAAAEHHAALAGMYEGRAQRLEAEIRPASVEEIAAAGPRAFANRFKGAR
jgi:hypothetical protein